jgi:GH24 family phage-related lysozyme (muramidase)
MGGSSGGMGLLGTLAMGAGVAGVGYMALSGDEAEAATPPSETPPPEQKTAAPKSSEVAKEAEQRVSQRRSENQQSDTRQIQKKVSQDQQTERLTKSAEETAGKQIGVTKAAAPQAASDWSSKLSNFIGKSVQASEARSAADAAGSYTGSDDSGETGSAGSASPSNAAEFIAFYEGFLSRAVDIGDGHQTLGFGHVIQPQEVKQGFIDVGGGGKIPVTQGRHGNGMGTPINKPQATSLLQTADLPKYVAGARRAIGSANWGKLNEAQETALVSYTYNAGEGGMRQLGKQGLVDAIAAGNSQLGADVIRTKGKRRKGSKFEKGLTRRRNAEADLFASGKMPGGVNQGQGTYTSGSQSKVQEFASGAVRGMSAGQGQAQLNSMGISGTNGNIS